MIKAIFLDKAIYKYLLVSMTAAIVNLLSRIIVGDFTSYTTSIVIAFFCAMITAYLLCRFFVFSSRKNTPAKQMFFFLLVNLIALVQTLIVSLILYHVILVTVVQDTFLREEIAHFLGVCAPVLTSYLGHKYFSFR